ncbi:LysR family transcriptional regulator [Crenobacter cavernae]|uniref:LysR family transcriptional regulator n=1 Tax=Crenobacter cavernae TaxID=2290923 RepID=A0A345Y4G9_9NEIS|nr:LysR family transcriptional regulator [Crenobacter cavernae]AXK38821.1 LysR family transcriptional regulator [Crenobacter cavernae]
MLDDLALFIAIVDAGSLQAAARQHGLPPATLTRRLQRLEGQLGCRLLHRSARRLLPTQAGQAYYEQCRPLVSALKQTTEALDVGMNKVQGLLRVLAPVNLARGLLAPVWTRFLAAHPEIRLELFLSNHNEDLWQHGADVAIRVGEQPDSTLYQRRLGTVELVVAGSPAYLAERGVPTHPVELSAHELLVIEPFGPWRFHDPDGGQTLTIEPSARCKLNELALAVTLAEAGLGLLYCPRLIAHEALQTGRLVQVMPGWTSPGRPLYAVWPQRQQPAKVRALIEHLSDFALATPLLQGAGPAALHSPPRSDHAPASHLD